MHDYLPPAFILFGLIFAGVGVYSIRVTRRLRRHGVRVPGVVDRLAYESGSGDSGGNYYPVLHFHTVEGAFVNTKADVGTNPPRVREGERVTVVYDPARPDRARPEIMLGAGTVLGVVAILAGVVCTTFATLITIGAYS